MNCNEDIHNELKEFDVICPFCDKQIDFVRKPKDDKCCDNRDIINDNGIQVCQSCGVVQGYDYVKEYIDFYENKHRFMRKSVYHREYHINNTIIDIEQKYNIKISTCQKIRLMLYFVRLVRFFMKLMELGKE